MAIAKRATQLLIAGLFLIGVLAGNANPARATVNATLVANPKSFNGACPTVISFSGSIYLSAAGTLQYRFVRSDGSLSPQNGFFSHTFPAAGTYTTADAMYKVSKSGSDKLQVYNPNGGALLQTATAAFTITCGQPGPPPTGGGAVDIGGIGPGYINTPGNLRTTTNPGDCPLGGLFGEVTLACAASIKNGDIVLLWDWSPGAGPSDIDGYNIYSTGTQSTSTSKYLSRNPLTPAAPVKQSQGADLKVAGLPNHGAACYTVRAYKGQTESADSNSVCIGNVAIGTQHLSLRPVPPLRSTFDFLNHIEGARGDVLGHHQESRSTDDSSTKITVGYRHATQSETGGDESTAWIWRGAVRFDLQSLAGRSILNATLHLFVRPGPFQPANSSCAAQIGTVTANIWEGAVRDTIPGDFFGDLPRQGYDITYDLTSRVREWTSGATNYGLVFKGDDESNPFNDAACLSDYGVRLDVEYFQ